MKIECSLWLTLNAILVLIVLVGWPNELGKYRLYVISSVRASSSPSKRAFSTRRSLPGFAAAGENSELQQSDRAPSTAQATAFVVR